MIVCFHESLSAKLILFQDDEFETATFSNQNKRPGYTAPAALLNDVAQVEIKI